MAFAELNPAVFLYPQPLLRCCSPIWRFRNENTATRVLRFFLLRPAPYYIECRVTEIDQFDASAVFGALRNQQHNHGRLLRVVVRVGDYKQDSFFGTGEGSIDLVPSDDDVFAIRHRIWLATDRAYKAATEALSAKQARLSQLKVDEPVDDFAKASPLESVEPLARFSSIDLGSLLHLLEEASAHDRADIDL